MIISGRGVTLSPSFKDAITRKVSKLEPLLPRLVEAKATCTAEKFRRTVRLTLRARRGVFSSVATATDLTAAVDGAVDSLARQVRRAKERRRLASRRRTRAARARRPRDETA
jgi:ribosomal subunit interface protein